MVFFAARRAGFFALRRGGFRHRLGGGRGAALTISAFGASALAGSAAGALGASAFGSTSALVSVTFASIWSATFGSFYAAMQQIGEPSRDFKRFFVRCNINVMSTAICEARGLARLHIAPGRVLDRLELALAGHARALGGHLLRRDPADPADPVGPPAALGLGRAGDELRRACRPSPRWSNIGICRPRAG